MSAANRLLSSLTLALTVAMCWSTVSGLNTVNYPNCSVAMTIDSSSTFNQLDAVCTQAADSSLVNNWVCRDLQSALSTLADMKSLNRSTTSNSDFTQDDCVSLILPAGYPHYIKAPHFLGNINVYFIGVSQTEDLGQRAGVNGSMLQLPSIVCNYTVNVDPNRIFDQDYDYIDYVLYFNRSKSIVFESLEVVNCPYPIRLNTVDTVRIHNSLFRNFGEAVFDLYNCHNISITSSTFHDNKGTGISRYAFRGNTGAVAVGFNGVPMEYTQPELFVSNCNFTRNSATASALFRSSSGAFFNRAFSGRGGGVGVFFNEDIHNVSVRIFDNFFESNFARSFGGAVFLVVFNEGTHHTMRLERNEFHSNIGMLGGGAVQMTFISNGITGNPHMTYFVDCLFSNNSGPSGGAVYIYPAFQGGDGNLVIFERSRFIGNRGLSGEGVEFGAAIGISYTNFFRNRESLPKHEINDCTFEENVGTNGIISIAYAPVSFSGSNTFHGNRGTSSLRIVGSLVEFYGSLSFVNNSVGDVAALHILSFGQARLTSQLKVEFVGNIGRYGASILVDTPTATIAFERLTHNPQCFALYEDPSSPPSRWKDVSISFRRNEAVLASSVHMSRLESCSWFSLEPPFFNSSFITQWPIWDFGNNSKNIGFDEPDASKYHVGTAAVAIDSLNDSVLFWPGHKFNISLTGWDQFNHPTFVSARFFATSNTTNKTENMVTLTPALVIAESDPRDDGKLTNNYELSYSVSNGDLLHISDVPLANVRIDVPFEDVIVRTDSFFIYAATCPAGYSLVPLHIGMECRCREDLLQILTCEDDQDTILIQSGYWVSASTLENPGAMRFSVCPAGYCRCSQETSLGSTMCVYTYKISEPDAQCTCNRQGVLCGECTPGLGVSALLNECVTCNNAFGLLIIILLLLDVIVFVVLALLDRSLPGWLYPFIFYLQIAPFVSQYFPESFEIVGKYLIFIGSALSLYFPYDFCLYENMRPMVSYFLRYVPVLVALIMCPFLIIIRRTRVRILNHYGLWWIVLLLYTPVVHTSLSILDCPYIETLGEYRWFVDGSVKCFTGWHAPLGLLAILMLLLCFAIIPLTVIIVLDKYPKRRLYWLRTLALPLKTNFKKEWKWWFAVELGRRLVFLIIFVPLPRINAIPLLFVCIMVAVYGLVQPYKSRSANILEITVLLNFLFLLMLQSTQLIKDSLFVFPNIQTANTRTVTNATVETCQNKYSGLAYLTWLLLPFYYLPLVLLVVCGVVYVIYLIREKTKTRRKAAYTFTHVGSSRNNYVAPNVKTQSIRLDRRRITHGKAFTRTHNMRHNNDSDSTEENSALQSAEFSLSSSMVYVSDEF